VNGDGSVYQRSSDGPWIGAVVLGYDEHGKQQRKTVSAKTRVDAQKKLRRLRRTVDDGLPPPNDLLSQEFTTSLTIGDSEAKNQVAPAYSAWMSYVPAVE
jgi:hypothetical protein